MHLWIFLLLLLLALPAQSSDVSLSPQEIERGGIRTELATTAQRDRSIRVVGQVVRSPDATHEMRSPVHGIVQKLRVEPGNAVRRGQVLMILHSHELHELATELRLGQREVEMAHNRLEAGRELFELEGISRVELERREQESLRAELTVEAIEVELEDLGMTADEVADLTVGSLHGELAVRAVASGVVLELHVSSESRVQPWETLLSIGKPDSLELDLQVQPNLATGIVPGDRIRFAPVGQPACCDATVITRVPQVDPTTRTVKIRAEVGANHPALLPGMFVEGMLVSSKASSQEQALTVVPAAAVIRAQGRDVVFVELSAGRYSAQPVEIARYNGSDFELLSGVTPGQRVVVEGTFLLKSKLLRGDDEGDGGDQETDGSGRSSGNGESGENG
jgi:cobalt-zinc-cadmium efflux system membrane fusion protein